MLRLRSIEIKSGSNSGCCCVGFRREFRWVGDGKICKRFRVRESRRGRADREATTLAVRSESESLSSAHEVAVRESWGSGGSKAWVGKTFSKAERSCR